MPLQKTNFGFFFAENPDVGGRFDPSKPFDPEVRGQLLPLVTSAERLSGVTRNRKFFLANRTDPRIDGIGGKFWLDLYTKTDDIVLLQSLGWRDNIPATDPARWYGCGRLNASVSAGATSIDVWLEDPSITIFQAGDLIALTSYEQTNPEYATVSAVSISGNIATLTLQSGLQNAWPGGLDANGNPQTLVAPVMQLGDLKPTVANVNVTSTGGNFDSAQIQLNNVGTIDQDWTLTFTSSTDYSVSGDTVGNIGSGLTTGDSSFGTPPYFTIPAAAFSGTFASGDTITFTTRPAAWPLWIRHIVPAGANPGEVRFGFQIDIDSI